MMLSLDVAAEKAGVENEALAATIYFGCMDRGLILNYPAYGSGITISFPLITRQADVDDAFEILDRTLAELM